MKVTRIEVQQRRRGRYSLFIDDKFYSGVGEAVLAESGLSIGKELSEHDLADLDKLLDLGKVRESALRSLSIRLNSTSEIRRKLKQKKFEEELIDETIRWLTDKGLLDDRLFAERLSESRRLSHHGEQRIIGELIRKGVTKEIINEIERPDEDEEIDSALLFLRRKYRAGLPEDRERAMRSLATRGFSYSVIRTAIKQFSETENSL